MVMVIVLELEKNRTTLTFDLNNTSFESLVINFLKWRISTSHSFPDSFEITF